MAMKLSSESFREGEMLKMDHVLSKAYGFGCEGGNLSPQLGWSDAPAGTQSFAVTCFDPDAPTGSGFWHWVVVNIPANVTALPLGAGDPAAGRLPGGALQVRTDFGKPGYGGPCPPRGNGPHRYFFRLYALAVPSLPLRAGATRAELERALAGHVIGQAQLMGRYERK